MTKRKRLKRDKGGVMIYVLSFCGLIVVTLCALLARDLKELRSQRDKDLAELKAKREKLKKERGE